MTDKLAIIKSLIEAEPSKPVVVLVTLLIVLADGDGLVRIRLNEIAQKMHLSKDRTFVLTLAARELGYISLVEEKSHQNGNLYRINIGKENENG